MDYPIQGKSRSKAYVADTNGLGLASSEEFLHLLPSIDMVVVVDDIPLTVGQLGEPVIISFASRQLSGAWNNTLESLPMLLTFRIHQ